MTYVYQNDKETAITSQRVDLAVRIGGNGTCHHVVAEAVPSLVID